VAALGIALEKSKAALEYADNLFLVAQRAHLSTDALQAYQFAAKLTGSSSEAAATAIEGFSVTLGKAQEGLTKSQRAFLALGFTKEQIKGFRDTDEALAAVAGRIGELKSNSQKDAIISQLGLDGLKALFELGPEKMREFLGEAKKAGGVMDTELLARGHLLNEEADKLTLKIGVELKSAFVDLGPVLVGLLGQLAQIADGAAAIVDAFTSIEHKGTARLEHQIKVLEDRDKGPLGGLFKATGDDKRIAARKTELFVREASEANAKAHPSEATGTRSLKDQGAKGPKGPTDADRRANADQAIDTATKDELAARAALTADIQALADLRAQEVDAELKKKADRLKAEVASKRLTQAAADQALALEQGAADLKKEKIARDARFALEDLSDQTRNEEVAAQLANLGVQQALARTAAERQRIELEILDLKQQELIHAKGKEVSRLVETGAITQGEGDKRFDATLSTLKPQRQEVLKNTQGPLGAFLDKAPKTIDELNASFQSLEAQGLGALNSGLADAIVNAKSLGDVGASVFRQMTAQVIELLLQFAEARVATAFGLPAYATGTSFAPGGLALVGERGPEVVNLPRGSQVIPHGLSLQGVASQRQEVIVQPVHFHLEGAVLTQDLVNQMERIGQRSAALGARVGADQGSAMAIKHFNSVARSRLGR
jgi:hypothetical protein